MSERLFVYGTLHPDRAPREMAAVVARFRPVGAGTVRARRYELGEMADGHRFAYPGAVLDRAAAPMAGHVFALADEPGELAEMLAALDAYEGYNPAAPETSLFVRERVTVAMDAGGEAQAWMYVYNGALPGRE